MSVRSFSAVGRNSAAGTHLGGQDMRYALVIAAVVAMVLVLLVVVVA